MQISITWMLKMREREDETEANEKKMEYAQSRRNDNKMTHLNDDRIRNCDNVCNGEKWKCEFNNNKKTNLLI